MSKLIITLLAIVISGVIIIVTLLYVSNQGKDASVKAQATKYQNDAALISGADEIFFNEKGFHPNNLQELTDGGYIKTSLSSQWSDSSSNSTLAVDGFAESTNVPLKVCQEINKRLKLPINPVPSCSDQSLPNGSCCLN